MEQNFWKKCSICKKEIPFSGKYYLCSVSTCRHKRKGFRFCSVECWDAHLGFANHRESWAEEAWAPSKEENVLSDKSQLPPRTGVRKIIETDPKPQQTASISAANIETDTLVVVSKVKKFIREQSGFNTSQCGIDALTGKIIEECLKGIEKARTAGRKTVMGRDIQ